MAVLKGHLIFPMQLLVYILQFCWCIIFVNPICSGRRSGWGGSRGSVERWGRDPSRRIGLVCSWFAVYWSILVFLSTRSCNVSKTIAASVRLFCNEYNDHLKFWIWFQNIFLRIILAGHVCFWVACSLISTGLCWFSQCLTLLIICARSRVYLLVLVTCLCAVTWTLRVTKKWLIRYCDFLFDPSLGPITTQTWTHFK